MRFYMVNHRLAIHETLFTNCASKWLFASMGPHVSRQTVLSGIPTAASDAQKTGKLFWRRFWLRGESLVFVNVCFVSLQIGVALKASSCTVFVQANVWFVTWNDIRGGLKKKLIYIKVIGTMGGP